VGRYLAFVRLFLGEAEVPIPCTDMARCQRIPRGLTKTPVAGCFVIQAELSKLSCPTHGKPRSSTCSYRLFVDLHEL
jgi:hypothetical protein